MAWARIWRTLAVVVVLGSVASIGWVLVGKDPDTQGWRAGLAGLVLGVVGIAMSVWFWWLGERAKVGDERRVAEARFAVVAEDLPTRVPPEIKASTRPSDLLWPDQQLMPFRGRARELEQLRAWCREKGAPRYFFVTGPALVGKTRLMVELAYRDIGPERRVSRLRPGHEKEAFAAISEVGGSHLIVVEVAASGPDLAAFITDVSAAREPFRWRVALVCRNPAAIPRLRDETARRVVETAARFTTGSLMAHGGAEDLRRWRSEAAAAFSRELGSEAPRSVGPVDAPGDPIGLVVARGLVDALGDSHEGEPVWASLVRRELLAWPDFPFGDGDRNMPGESVARRCFAMVWLLGLSTRDQVHDLITRVLSEDAAHLREVVSFLMGLYPDEQGRFSPPYDPITTWIALPELLTQGEVVADLVAERDLLPQANAVAKLIASTNHFPQAAELAALILDRAGAALKPSVLVRLGTFRVFDRRLDQLLADILVAHPPRDTADVTTLVDELTGLGLALAASVAQEVLVELLRLEARDHPDRYNPDLAVSLNTYAIMLSELGRPEPALAAAEEGLTLYRELARDHPGRYNPDLAVSLITYANMLSELGRPESALAAAEEGLTLYRELARDHPGRYNPDLALSLNTYAIRLSDLGRPEPALAAAEESLTLRRELARDHPGRYNHDLEVSLINYANRLSDLGRPEPALAAAEEALTLRRELARDHPGRYNPDLAGSLTTYANRLRDLRRPEPALAAAGESLTLYRELARDHPGRYNPDLARSLNNYAIMLSELGRPEPALAAAGESLALYRELARDRPGRYNPDLALSLNNYAIRLSDLGRPEPALAAAEEALTLYRELARDHPGRYNPDLAFSLNNYAIMLSELGRPEPALAAAEEALTLSGPDSVGFREEMARARRLAAATLARMGRLGEADRVIADLPRVPPSARPSS